MDTILRDAIRLPQGFPKKVLRGSLQSMGLGVPNLLPRFAVRRVAVLLRAINSRSVYVRQAVRSRWDHPELASQPYHDALRARADLWDWGLDVQPAVSPKLISGEGPSRSVARA